ncbi:MAG: hypothetical protein A2939_00220 [Parcubacteria group bacterium RIFCSPLOWO2_01_FULL_48_18]|nr:MAG: hypothetical protein A3J67_05815 [Parcubacteria group bacterium RIFCSPHIGHO2_02_FULL_48_10b]OHB22189.1 MAG: hypothetical protein A2939_00220 [Parcubacteria group bacterium RIFCSPLOWO2_01_FULL_48_18]
MAYYRNYRKRNYHRPYYHRRYYSRQNRPIDPKKAFIAFCVLLIFGIISNFESFLSSSLFPILLVVGGFFVVRKILRNRRRAQISNAFAISKHHPYE